MRRREGRHGEKPRGREDAPNIPKLFPRKLPRLVQAFKILLIRNFIDDDDPSGRCIPSLRPHAPPRTRPIPHNARQHAFSQADAFFPDANMDRGIRTGEIGRPSSITQLIRPPTTRQRAPRARQIRHFCILQRQVIQVITQRRQGVQFRRVVR